MANDWFKLDPRIAIRVTHPAVEATWPDGLDRPPHIREIPMADETTPPTYEELAEVVKKQAEALTMAQASLTRVETVNKARTVVALGMVTDGLNYRIAEANAGDEDARQELAVLGGLIHALLDRVRPAPPKVINPFGVPPFGGRG